MLLPNVTEGNCRSFNEKGIQWESWRDLFTLAFIRCVAMLMRVPLLEERWVALWSAAFS